MSLAKLSEPSEPRKRRQSKRGRPSGALNKRTVMKQLEAEANALKHRGRKLAVDHIDDAVTWIVDMMKKRDPFNEDGTLKEGADLEF